MNRADDPARNRVIRQVLSARELPDVLAATEALRQWMREHPDDQGIRDGFEQLSLMQDIHEWRAANPEEWEAQQEAERRAIAAHQPERDRMLRDARGARTPAQLDQAEQELLQWAADFPEDVGRELGIIEALEQVLTQREALAGREAPALAARS